MRVGRLSPALSNLLGEMRFTQPLSAQALRTSMPQIEKLLGLGLIREVTAPEVTQGNYNHREHRKFVRVMLDADPGAIPPEHQFAGKTVEQWEADVVRRAAYFVVSRSLHNGRHETFEYQSMAEAMEKAQSDRRFCLSAVAPTGRFATLDRKQWDHYLEVFSAREPKASGR